jgi:hypothetical protein
LNVENVYRYFIVGGENDGKPPMLGIRIENNEITANICGSKTSQGDASCVYYDLGVPSLGRFLSVGFADVHMY